MQIRNIQEDSKSFKDEGKCVMNDRREINSKVIKFVFK
jgi:hypothetical protein